MYTIVLGEVLRADVSVFSIIALIISTGVGTALTLEMDSWANNELSGDASRDFFERPFFLPFWGLVGYFNEYDLPLQVGAADPTRVVAALLIFAYLIAIIVLVNLMVAAMSETYQRVRVSSRLYHLHERAKIIQEFKRKGALPPPLNVITVVIVDLPRVLRWLLRACGCMRGDGQGGGGGEISRDGFRLVPGPTQQQVLQRRLLVTLRRCLKRQGTEQEQQLESRVAELQAQLVQMQAESRSSFEHLSVLHRELAANGPMTARSGLAGASFRSVGRSALTGASFRSVGQMSRRTARQTGTHHVLPAAALADSDLSGRCASACAPSHGTCAFGDNDARQALSDRPQASRRAMPVTSSARRGSPPPIAPEGWAPLVDDHGSDEVRDGGTERAERLETSSGAQKERPERTGGPRRRASFHPDVLQAAPTVQSARCASTHGAALQSHLEA